MTRSHHICTSLSWFSSEPPTHAPSAAVHLVLLMLLKPALGHSRPALQGLDQDRGVPIWLPRPLESGWRLPGTCPSVKLCRRPTTVFFGAPVSTHPEAAELPTAMPGQERNTRKMACQQQGGRGSAPTCRRISSVCRYNQHSIVWAHVNVRM